MREHPLLIEIRAQANKGRLVDSLATEPETLPDIDLLKVLYQPSDLSQRV
jgi:hypothetical protein